MFHRDRKLWLGSTELKRFLALSILSMTPVLAQISIGIQIGAPPPPRVVRVLPPRPAPEFIWIEGYWYPAGKHYKWHDGYWTRPAYPAARWVTPRYEGGRYFAGYWVGDAGRREHDHHWDRDRNRDSRSDDHDRGRGHDHR